MINLLSSSYNPHSSKKVPIFRGQVVNATVRSQCYNALESNLSKIAREIRTKAKEVCVILDPESGNELFRVHGDADKIEFTDIQIQKLKGKILIHNHPNGKVRTLTRIDVTNTIKWGVKKIIAVSKNEYHSITFPDNLDYHTPYIRINSFDSYRARKEFAARENLPTNLYHSDIELPETDEKWRGYMWATLGKELGWEYNSQIGLNN